jgi:RNA polymerase sigma-70 factor (ECF subfamily)
VNAFDWRAELERLHGASFAWARHCCGNRRDRAEEVLQDVYLRVLDGRARFDGRSSAKTWLFGVIRRTASEHARSGWLRSMRLERWYRREPDAPTVPDPERLLHTCERNDRLRAALGQLPPRQRAVLHLVYYQDLTVEESAQTLGISVGSARTHFARGKERLRALLTQGELA